MNASSLSAYVARIRLPAQWLSEQPSESLLEALMFHHTQQLRARESGRE